MHAGTIIRHDVLQSHYQSADVQRRADFSQGIQPCQHITFRNALAYENANLLMGRGHSVLKNRAELFIEFLSWAHAREFNLDILVRFQAREENQVPCQINNFYGLAHIKDADLATLSDGRCPQHKLAGFGNGHEEAPHVRMRDCYRSAQRDLLLEDGDDATIRTQDIAEAYSHILSPPVLQGKQQKFGEAFSGAHNVGRPYCFI